MLQDGWKVKKRVNLLILIGLIITLGFNVLLFNLNKPSLENLNEEQIPQLADATFTKEWIKNGNFSTEEYWNFTEGIFGDPEDLNATISEEEANFFVLGDKGVFTLIADPPNKPDWMNFTNPELPVLPDNFTFDQNGLHVEHKWDGPTEQLENNPSIHFKQNITMPVNMSDFTITSASIQMRVNATVTVSPINGGIEREGDSAQYLIGDYIRFYVLISDVNNSNSYPIAEYKTTELGKDGPPSIDELNDTYLIPVPEEILISYLMSILKTDNYNFTITLGMDIYCEDNSGGSDRDYWDDIRINYFKLNFTYLKKIDQFTSISCNQIGDIPSNISSNSIMINDAILNFEYKINEIWPISSPNSEFRIIFNNILHLETVKLVTANTTFQNAKLGGFDVKYLIDEDKDVNLSIQVYIADEFELNHTIEISIDNVSLNITYTETTTDKPSNLQLFLNRVNATSNPFIEIPFGENLNITIKYTNQTADHITGALVELQGKINDVLDENSTFQHYYTIINTSQLGLGVTILKIIAQKNYYEDKTEQIFVEVTERETELELFLNGDPIEDGGKIEAELDKTINVTVYYRDSKTNAHLPNATVNLLDIDKLNETVNHYYIYINTKDDLNETLNDLTIYAYLLNYKFQSIRFFIEVIERPTNVLLFLNKNDEKNIEDKSFDPNIAFPVGTTLNITIKYQDNDTGAHISNATIQLIGKDLIELEEDLTFFQYFTVLKETDLKIGVNLFSIVAQATNYQIKTLYPRITVNRIATSINISSPITTESGADVLLVVALNDLNFGGTIRNATVTYRWAYGQGELYDPDNNGIYNIVLENVPIGTFTITITAFAGDKYDFESIDITLVVNPPGAKPGINWGWLIYLLIGTIAGLVTIFSLYQLYFRYPPMIRKIKKLRKKIQKNRKPKPLVLRKREDLINHSLQNSLQIIEPDEINTKRIKSRKNNVKFKQ